MSINDFVLVRESSNLPLMRMIIPIEHTFIMDDIIYKKIITKLVKEKLESYLKKELDLTDNHDREFFEDIVKAWYPTIGGYTPNIRFTLNGVEENSRDNKVAVIDPLKNHEQEEYLCVSEHEVVIRNNFNLSDEAIVLVEEERFLNSSQLIQADLKENYNLVLYRGSLKEAINNVLKEHKYQTIEELDSSTISLLDVFAREVNSSNLTVQQLKSQEVEKLSGNDLIAKEKLLNDSEKRRKIIMRYETKFYEYLVNKLEEKGVILSLEEKNILFTLTPESEVIVKKLVDQVLKHFNGLNGLKDLVSNFNINVFDYVDVLDKDVSDTIKQ